VDTEVNPQPPVTRQFARYAGVGIIGTAIHFAIYIALVTSGFAIVISSAAGFIVSALSNYWLNYHYTFTSEQPHHLALRKFFSVALIGLALNTLIMFILDKLHWHYILAQVVAAIMVLAWNFAANRRWTFGGE
jgi:putative flippase GtrA